MIPQSAINDAIAHAKECAPHESCGLIVDNKYFRCTNIAIESEHFVLNPADLAKVEDSDEILAIVHSHVNLPPQPSQADLVGCERSGKPWLIVSVPNETYEVITPSGYTAPYIGREFVHGVCDCYTLVRDWYAREMGIVLNEYQRFNYWWDIGGNMYEDHLKTEGFVEVRDELRRGDGLLMMVRAPVINHSAIYLGDGRILHHVQDRLSRVDIYGGMWQKFTVKHVRHSSVL